MTVWGSSLQIGCRLILLISEHPIQQGIRKECWHRIPGNGTEFLAKWRSLRKKVSLTPKKWKFGSKKKSLSPNPSGHGLFAKNCIKIGLVWPQQLHFWSTGAYRGFPPYAIFPLPAVRLNLRHYRGIQKILKSYRWTRICKFSRQKCRIYKFLRQKCRIYMFSRQKLRFWTTWQKTSVWL